MSGRKVSAGGARVAVGGAAPAVGPRNLLAPAAVEFVRPHRAWVCVVAAQAAHGVVAVQLWAGLLLGCRLHSVGEARAHAGMDMISAASEGIIAG